MLDTAKYFMGRDSQYSKELTEEIKTNAKTLVEKINALLKDLNWTQSIEVSSGWRPAAINNATSNAAKKSLHMTGEACDLKDDKDQTLAKLIQSKPELLKKHGLWLEHPEATKGKFTNWCHLDMSTKRTDRAIRVFKP